jgi:type II secretory pathway pseudopilin PulG
LRPRPVSSFLSGVVAGSLGVASFILGLGVLAREALGFASGPKVPASRRIRAGLTLFFILGILGMLAAIVIPNLGLMSARPGAKVSRAVLDAKVTVTQAILYGRDKGAYPTSLGVLRDFGYAGVFETDPWNNPYVLAPVLTSGATPRDGDDVYIYSKGPKGTGTYPRPFTEQTGKDGSSGYSSLYGSWSGS